MLREERDPASYILYEPLNITAFSGDYIGSKTKLTNTVQYDIILWRGEIFHFCLMTSYIMSQTGQGSGFAPTPCAFDNTGQGGLANYSPSNPYTSDIRVFPIVYLMSGKVSRETLARLKYCKAKDTALTRPPRLALETEPRLVRCPFCDKVVTSRLLQGLQFDDINLVS
jgi:hypothetical protein